MTGDELQREISDAICSVEGLTDDQILQLYQNFVDLMAKLIQPFVNFKNVPNAKLDN